MNSWWDTPSCSGFLENISNEIWAGKITMVFLPMHTPDGFLSELKKRLEKGDTIQYLRTNIDECDRSESRPVESMLITHFELNGSKESYIPRKASSIFQNIENDPATIHVLQNIPLDLLTDFKNFLSDLGRYFNSLTIPKRQKVLVLIDPFKFKHDDFITEPGMAKFIFEGVIGDLDQALAIRHYHNFNHSKQKRFPESIIISLSQFDCRLCDKLISFNDVSEKYGELLEQFALENGWANYKFKPEDQLSDAEVWERWSLGIIDKSDKKLVYNSAFLKIHHQIDELEKRLWLSGIKTLLPMIEELRIKMILSKKIQFPFKFLNQKTGELKESTFSFEIGEIKFMIYDGQIVLNRMSVFEKRKLKDFVELCRSIRNDLSHLKMPAANDIKKFFDEIESVLLILEN
jgi:hypothetical protein